MVIDYGQNKCENRGMDEMSVSKFKATCLAVLKRVQKTRKPIRITKFGKPIATVVPLDEDATNKSWLGSMAGTAEIVGDIVSPAVDEQDWEVLR